MATDLYCPDCGGVIGGTGENGARACTCFENEPKDPRNDTDVMAAPVASERVVSNQPTKVCCMCGVDVSGKKRAKDSRGYWCYACHKAERAREKEAETAGKMRCPKCGRMVPPGSIVHYDGETMCTPCKNDEMELRGGRKKFKEVGDTHFKETEKRRIKIMLGILLVLGMIILLNHFHLLPTVKIGK